RRPPRSPLFPYTTLFRSRLRTIGSECHGACDGRRRRHAQCPNGADEGRRRTRVRVLHEPRKPQGSGTRGRAESRAVLPLEEPAPPGPRAWRREGGGRQRSGCLFQFTASRQPYRSLGIETIAPAGKPIRAGEGGGAVCNAICSRPYSSTVLLVGLPARAGRDGILARATVSPA